jgi:hypothetical protein
MHGPLSSATHCNCNLPPQSLRPKPATRFVHDTGTGRGIGNVPQGVPGVAGGDIIAARAGLRREGFASADSSTRRRPLLLNLLPLAALPTFGRRDPVATGMGLFRAGDVPGSLAAFDEALVQSPALAPYLWQRGLSLYLAGAYAEGAAQVGIA